MGSIFAAEVAGMGALTGTGVTAADDGAGDTGEDTGADGDGDVDGGAGDSRRACFARAGAGDAASLCFSLHFQNMFLEFSSKPEIMFLHIFGCIRF